jgi:cell wall-associated NlpC family hydrolase
MAERTPIIPLTIAGVGAYLAWFGIHYWRSDVKWPTDPIKAILTGQPLPDNAAASLALELTPVTPLVTASTGKIIGQIAGENSLEAAASGASGSSALGTRIAADAQLYKGAGYEWGGNASQTGDWDCSSFVSKVLGQDFGLPLPGGGKWGDPGYPPHAHGPGSTQYMLYGTGVDLGDVQAGDLIVSVEHIGICIGGRQMISAMDPQLGTNIGTFPEGFPSGPPVYRRVSV